MGSQSRRRDEWKHDIRNKREKWRRNDSDDYSSSDDDDSRTSRRRRQSTEFERNYDLYESSAKVTRSRNKIRDDRRDDFRKEREKRRTDRDGGSSCSDHSRTIRRGQSAEFERKLEVFEKTSSTEAMSPHSDEIVNCEDDGQNNRTKLPAYWGSLSVSDFLKILHAQPSELEQTTDAFENRTTVISHRNEKVEDYKVDNRRMKEEVQSDRDSSSSSSIDEVEFLHLRKKLVKIGQQLDSLRKKKEDVRARRTDSRSLHSRSKCDDQQSCKSRWSCSRTKPKNYKRKICSLCNHIPAKCSGPIKCYICKKRGHIANECWYRLNALGYKTPLTKRESDKGRHFWPTFTGTCKCGNQL